MKNFFKKISLSLFVGFHCCIHEFNIVLNNGWICSIKRSVQKGMYNKVSNHSAYENISIYQQQFSKLVVCPRERKVEISN